MSFQSQVRENKDEIEDERAKNENLESRIVQLEQEKARLHRDQIKKLDEKQKWYDDEIDRLHNEKETVRQQHQEDINELLLNKKTLEDAIFNANDSYDEIDAENKNFRKELHGITHSQLRGLAMLTPRFVQIFISDGSRRRSIGKRAR